jgi:hypothetical protein
LYGIKPRGKQMLGIFEDKQDDGESYLLDWFFVASCKDFNDPYEPLKVLFEGNQRECEQYVIAYTEV